MQVDDPEFASISAQVRQMDRAQLERTAAIVSADVSQTGQARAELVRSDRYRLKNRSAPGASLRLIAIRTGQITRLTMFDEAGLREAARQKFEEELAQRQMDHASALASCRF